MPLLVSRFLRDVAQQGSLVFRFPIRLKLALLAGVPVLGAVLLSLLIIRDAREQSQKAEAIGSVESLAELSALMSELVGQLQRERAMLCRDLGLRTPLAVGAAGAERAKPSAGALRTRFSATDGVLQRLNVFLQQRDLSELPERLSRNLGSAREQLQTLSSTREQKPSAEDALLKTLADYRGETRDLISATAALAELSDDGELLREITALVSSMELKERASEQHALLSYSLAAKQFPPGSYRLLVTLVSEEETHLGAFRTLATAENASLLNAAMAGAKAVLANELRQRALDATEEEIDVTVDAWFEAQQAKIEALQTIESTLNERVRRVALQKLTNLQRATLLGSGLAAAVVIFSMALGWVIARGVSRSVSNLNQATLRVTEGDLDARVSVNSNDELGTLGATFNHMIEEVANARVVLQEQVRMASELEIAASIQTSLLPPGPVHADFEFAGKMLPADEVGGDFYDVLTRRDSEQLWLTIGDVSNHGLSAGLVMLMAQTAFAGQFESNPDANPADVFKAVNRLLCMNITERLKDNKYITCQLLTYRGDGRFECAGGHEPALIFRAQSQTCEIVEAKGPWLGILPDLTDVPVSSLELESGDILCLYTDGLTEARNANQSLFDVERFRDLVAEAAAKYDDLEQLAEEIFAGVERFAVGRDDDWTLLLSRRK